MIYGLLAAVFALCVLGAWASFTDSVRNGRAYIGLMAWVSVSTGILFAYGAVLLNSKPRIFVFSLYYDIAMATAYYLLPLLFFGCRVHSGTIIGAVLILCGLIALHCGGEQ